MNRQIPFVILTMLLFAADATGTVRYRLTDLTAAAGGAAPGVYTLVGGINNAGDVVGGYSPGNTSIYQGFLYHNGVATPLAAPGSASTYGQAINSAGQIAADSDSPWQSFFYSNGAYTDLGAFTSTVGINAAGEIAGELASDGQYHAFVWSSGGGMVRLPEAGARESQALGINDAGRVVGILSYPGESHGFLYADGSLQDLGKVFQPFAINNAAQIVGRYLKTINGITGEHAALYANGTITDLDPNDLASYSTQPAAVAMAINNLGQIVGIGQFGAPYGRATLFEGGRGTDLNTLISPGSGLTLFSATGINDLGQIIGQAQTSKGDIHAYLLTPIPEPQAAALLALAGAALIRRGRGK